MRPKSIKLFTLRLIILIGVIEIVESKDALQYFLRHKKIVNSSVQVLNKNGNESEKVWIEYKYSYFNKNDNNGSVIMEDEENTISDVMKNNINLKVGIKLDKSSSFDCDYEDDGGNSTIKGYSFEILEILEEMLNLTIQYSVLNTSEASLDDVLGKEIDLLIICGPSASPISKTGNDNIRDLEELYPIIQSKYLVIFRTPSTSQGRRFLDFSVDIFVVTFAGSLWLVFVITLIVSGICFRITTIQYSVIYSSDDDSLYYPWSWVEITLWAIATACQQGLSRSPNGFSARVTFLVGYLTAYLLYTGFAAGITSLLVRRDAPSSVNPVFTGHVTNGASNPYLICLSSHDSWVLEDNQDLGSRYRCNEYAASITDIFNRINNFGVSALLPEIIFEEHLLKSNSTSRAQFSSCFSTIKIESLKYERGFSIHKNNTSKHLFRKSLQRLEESGILESARKRNLLRSATSVPMKNQELGGSCSDFEGYSSAGLEHVGSAVLLLLGGIAAAIIFILFECLLAYYHNEI